MIIYKGTSNRKELYFLVVLFSYILIQVFLESNLVKLGAIGQLLSFAQYALLVLFCISIVDQHAKTSKKGLILIVIMLAVALFSMILYKGGSTVISLLLIILAARSYPLEKIFKTVLFSLIIGHLFVIICSKLGIVSNQVDWRYIGDYMGSFFNRSYYRHSLGMLVHNQVPLAFMIAYFLLICIKKERITIIESMVIIGINVFLFNYCGSRITFVLVLLTMMAYYAIRILEKLKKRNVRLPIWFSWVFPVLMIISLVMAYKYNSNSSLFLFADTVFNNRISLGHEALKYYSITLFGSGANAATYDFLSNNTVDNGYLALLIQRGIILSVCIVGIWTYLCRVCLKKSSYMAIVIILFAVENLINAHFLSYKMIPCYCILFHANDVFLAYSSNRQKTSSRRVVFKKSRPRLG